MKTYAWPVALWSSAVIGLVTMLLEESAVGDGLGLLLLCLPLAVMARFSMRAKS